MTAPRPGRVLALILSVAILAAILLIQTNSRSSILIKEVCAVLGAVAMMAVGSLFILTGSPAATSRISRPMLLSLLALLSWIVVRQFTGIQSVNGPLLIHYLLALSGLVVATVLLFDRRDRDTVLWSLVGGTGILTLYALTQTAGLTLFKWDAGLIAEARSSGSLGNPNLLGSFAAAMIPVGAGFLIGRKRLGRFRGVLASLFALLCIGALVASETRGSLIGLASLLVLIPLLPSVRRSGLKRLAMLLLAVVLLLGIAGAFLRDRLAEVSDSDENSTLGVRLLIWRGAVSMIGERPLAGWGPGSFQIVFPEYRDPTYSIQGVSHNTLHAHCEYLEILTDLGLVGLLLWGALALSTAARVRKWMRIRTEDGEREAPGSEDPAGSVPRTDWTALGLIGGIASLLTEGIVSVALRWPPSAFLIALLTALLLVSIPAVARPVRRAGRWIIAVPLLALAAFLSVEALPAYSRALVSGRLLFMGKDYYLDQVEKSIVQAMAAAENWVQTGSPQAMSDGLALFDQAMAFSDSSIKISLRCTEVNPLELGGWYSLGSSYLTRAMLHRPVSGPMIDLLTSNGREPFDYDKAALYVQLGLESYDSLMARAPDYAETHNNLALAWSNAGNVDRTLGALRDAYRLYAHNREQYGRQLDVISPLAETVDVCHMIWVRTLEIPEEELQRLISDPRFDNVLRSIFFRSGICLLSVPGAADSIAASFAAVADSMVPSIAATLLDGIAYQLAEMPSGIDLQERFLAGDTTGVLEALSGYSHDQLMRLPMHSAIKGCLLAGRGDPEGLQLLEWVTGVLTMDCVGRITAWPLGMESFRAMAGALGASGLDEVREREHFNLFTAVCLNLDWLLFKVTEMMTTSPGYQVYVPGTVRDAVESSWAVIGGPLYCLRHRELVADSSSVLPFIAPGSVLGTCMLSLSALSDGSPEDAGLVMERVHFYYAIYLSFYLNNPAFTQEQAWAALDSLRIARLDLTGLLGEEESRYQMNAMFARTMWGEQILRNPRYDQLMQTLRSDIISGDLPDL